MSLGFHTPAEVAKLLNLQPRAIYKAIQDGELRAYRFRGRIRIKAEDLTAYIEGAQV